MLEDQKFISFDKHLKMKTREPLEEFIDALRKGRSGPAQYWKKVLERRLLNLEKWNGLRHRPDHYTGRPRSVNNQHLKKKKEYAKTVKK